MLNGIPSLNDVKVDGKTVLVRADLDVPLRNHVVADDTRLRAAMPTITELAEKGARVLVCGHLGRPNGAQSEYSLRPAAEHMQSLTKHTVKFCIDCIGDPVQAAVDELQPGEILVLENTRFHAEEKQNDPHFARQLATHADIYVNDAFSTAHRSHASTVGVVSHINHVALGRQLHKEMETLQGILEKPKRPLVVTIGGAKISTKIGVLQNLLNKADCLLIGGAMANTFFAAKGHDMKKSLVEHEFEETARNIMTEAAVAGCRLVLPQDIVVSTEFAANAPCRTTSAENIAADEMALDIGPETIKSWDHALGNAGTILWNGPVGAFELKPFDKGSTRLAQAITATNAFKVAGGGDTLAAIHNANCEDRFDYLSTAGGALLELLEGKQLPALLALHEHAKGLAA